MSYFGGDRDRSDRGNDRSDRGDRSDRDNRGSDRDSNRDRDRGRTSDRNGDSDRPNPCRLYVGKVSRYVREQDLRDLFAKYGRIRDLVLRDFYAFIEFDNQRDADDAAKGLNGHKLEEERLIVQVANKARNRMGGDDGESGRRSDNRDSYRDNRRSDRSDRDFDRNDRDRGSSRRGGNNDANVEPGTDRCYNCGEFGHIANECSLPKGSGERAMRFQKGCCFECGQSGHRARDCPDRADGGKGASSSRRRSRSRSPGRSRGPPRRSSRRSSRSPARRVSRSPARRSSPSPRRRNNDRSRSRSASPRRRSDDSGKRSVSPKRRSSPSPRRRSASKDSVVDIRMED